MPAFNHSSHCVTISNEKETCWLSGEFYIQLEHFLFKEKSDHWEEQLKNNHEWNFQQEESSFPTASDKEPMLTEPHSDPSML